MDKVFEKISDFHGKEFWGLWGNFSCRCYVNNDTIFVYFCREDNNRMEKFFVNGDKAIDLFDFVLSEYYKDDDTKIEDGFSCWLSNNYHFMREHNKHENVQKIDLPFDEVGLELAYNSLLSDWKKQSDNIKRLCRIIKRKNKRIKKLENKIKHMEKQITASKTNNLTN